MYDFITSILELWGMAQFQDFSAVMYDERLYTIPFWIMLITPIVALTFYYKVMDSINGASVGRWLLYGVGASLVVFLFNFLYLNNKDTRLQLDFIFADMFAFLFITFLWSMIIFLVLSFLFKNFSTHRKYVPV